MFRWIEEEPKKRVAGMATTLAELTTANLAAAVVTWGFNADTAADEAGRNIARRRECLPEKCYVVSLLQCVARLQLSYGYDGNQVRCSHAP